VRRLDGGACAEGLASKAFGASLIITTAYFSVLGIRIQMNFGLPDPIH
jgi:hypothetical protein